MAEVKCSLQMVIGSYQAQLRIEQDTMDRYNCFPLLASIVIVEPERHILLHPSPISLL